MTSQLDLTRFYEVIIRNSVFQLDFLTREFQIPLKNNRFQESYNVKYFKEIKRLKSLPKAEAYLEPNQASMMELSDEYT